MSFPPGGEVLHPAGIFLQQGDTLRWRDVFADVDVSLRYIHDIMKVDVILKREFMNDLRSVVSEGSLSSDAFLTARFDIDLVEINSAARQGGAARDLFAPSLSLDTPLEFVRDDSVVHKLRPVEVFALDVAGDPVFDPATSIRTRQVWRLQQNAPGIAEMSAKVGDLVALPDGDVVIDPSMEFGRFNVATRDAELAFQSSTNLGGAFDAAGVE